MTLLQSTGFDWWDEDTSQYMFDYFNTNTPAESYIVGTNTRTDSPHSDTWCGALQVGATGATWRTLTLPYKAFTVIVGIGVHRSNEITNNTNCGILFGNDSGHQGGIQFSQDGRLRAVRSTTTLLASSRPGVMSAHVYRHFEIKWHVDNTSGEFEVRCDGEPIFSGENLDTQVYADGITWVRLSAADEGWHWFDDVYILDDQGSYNNDFIGHPEVKTSFVVASGEYSQWLPSSGENYECIDDNFALDDSDYLVASGENSDQLDSFKLDEFTFSGGDTTQVYGINIWSCQNAEMSTMQRISHTIRIGSSDYSGEMMYLPFGNCFTNTVFERDPSDDGAWEESVLNAAEFGVKRYKNT